MCANIQEHPVARYNMLWHVVNEQLRVVATKTPQYRGLNVDQSSLVEAQSGKPWGWLRRPSTRPARIPAGSKAIRGTAIAILPPVDSQWPVWTRGRSKCSAGGRRSSLISSLRSEAGILVSTGMPPLAAGANRRRLVCGPSKSASPSRYPAIRHGPRQPTPRHENGRTFSARPRSGNVDISWYARVRQQSDVGARRYPALLLRARRGNS